MQELSQRKGTLEMSVGQLEQAESEHRNRVSQLANEIKQQHRTSLKSAQQHSIQPSTLNSSPPPPPPLVTATADGEGGVSEAKDVGKWSTVQRKGGDEERGGGGGKAGLTESWMVEGGGETEDSDVAMDILELEHTTSKVSDGQEGE